MVPGDCLFGTAILANSAADAGSLPDSFWIAAVGGRVRMTSSAILSIAEEDSMRSET